MVLLATAIEQAAREAKAAGRPMFVHHRRGGYEVHPGKVVEGECASYVVGPDGIPIAVDQEAYYLARDGLTRADVE